MKKITNVQIQKFLKYKLSTDKVWAQSALLKIYSNQTKDEQATGSTNVYNNIGFSSTDSQFLTSLANSYQNYGKLSDRQMEFLFKKIQKYWKQILNISDKEILEKQVINAIQNGVIL